MENFLIFIVQRKETYMSLLKRYIKESLLLENNLNSKILSIVDKLDGLGKKTKVLIERIGTSGFSVTIFVEKENIAHISFMLADRVERKGKRERKWVVNPSGRGPKKRKAYQVAHSKAVKGFGPLVYEIGLEVISGLLMFPGALLSDRRKVSQDAKKVWDTYLKRASTEQGLHAIKMDIDKVSLKRAKLNQGIEIEQMTPDFEEDDLRQDSTLDYLNSGQQKINWKDVEISLCYAFYKDKFTVLSYINKKDNIDIIYNLD